MKLKNMNVVITGGLKKMTRSEAFEAIKKAGGTPRKKISGRTDLLVVGDTPWMTEKLCFAENHWTINVVTENDFYALLGVQ